MTRSPVPSSRFDDEDLGPTGSGPNAYLRFVFDLRGAAFVHLTSVVIGRYVDRAMDDEEIAVESGPERTRLATRGERHVC